MLDFVAFAARPMPLLTLLDEAPRRIVALLEADVCSLYLLEGDKSELVMRGNVGLSNAAIGQVRLRVGEGITGEAIEYMRPISTETAEQHEAYKHFAGIGEERFPVFLAVPILGKAGPLGAVVVQRSAVPFTDADIELLALIGGLIAAGSRHAELVDEVRERRARRTGGGTRKVTLAGRPVMVGRALGAVAALRRPPRRAERAAPGAFAQRHRSRRAPAPRARSTSPRRRSRGCASGRAAIGLEDEARVLDDLRRDPGGHALPRARHRARGERRGRAPGALEGRPRRDAGRRVGDARRVPRGARARRRGPLRRAHDARGRRSALGAARARRSSWATPSRCSTCWSARGRSRRGIALSERASGPRTRVLLKLMNVPAVADVKGLFRWAADGDIALLDGDHGLLVINPTKSEVASLREHRRSAQEPDRPERTEREPRPRVTMRTGRRDPELAVPRRARAAQRRRRRRRPRQRHRRERHRRPLRDDVLAARRRRS